MPQADDLIERAKELYLPVGAEWKEQQKQFTFPAGGRLRFRPLENTQDAQKYQGQNLSGATIEESGNYASPDPIDRLWGAMRGGKAVQMLQTANPGGPGQQWIKERYVDPCPSGNAIIKCELPNGAEHERIFIPSKVADNRALLDRDPEYVNRLYLVGSEALVRAWLAGDWNAVEGAFFDGWHRGLIIEPQELPEFWLRFRSMDWGYAAPFSIGWWAVASDDFPARTIDGNAITIPRGAMIRYREWYGALRSNVGVRMDAELVAEGIKEREAGEDVKYGVLDPSAFAQDGGPSIAERMFKAGVAFRQADNRRVSQRGALSGWDQMRARIRGDAEGRPLIYCFSTCRDSIRTIPALPHDQNKAEDLDTDAEDHAADDWRYGCMSRPLMTQQPEPEPDLQEIFAPPSFEEMREMNVKRLGKRRRI